MKFSVLMSIYYKEKPEYFNRAMKSIWDEQNVKPNEIILVEDGELTEGLYKIIEEWQKKLDGILKIIPLKKNLGLVDALNIGLNKCSYALIARMDTDDIALPQRFKKQLKVFKEKNIDVCGSLVSEFENNENEIISYRKVPKDHTMIVKFAKKRNPINHPTIMYKKDKVLEVGGYKKMIWFEDYYLWIRMILNGAKFYNIQEPLVKMRAGYGQLKRRSGFKYAIEEFKFQRVIFIIRFLSKKDFVKNITLRFFSRIVPKFVIRIIYKLLRN